VALAPIAIDVAPDAVVVLPAKPPIAIACPPVAVPPPAEYCACATFMPALALRTTTAIALATDDLFGLPRADEISDAATHAPRASFQMVLYDLFILTKASQVTRDTNRPTGIQQTNRSDFSKIEIPTRIEFGISGILWVSFISN
jgi:hypothetical protein